MNNVRKMHDIKTTLIYTILVITTIAILYPIIFVIIGSLNPGQTLFATKIIPKRLTFLHYDRLFTEKDYIIWYANTLKIAFFTMILSTILVVTTAYSLSRFRFPGRRQSLMAMLVLQMFPSFMGLIAIYILLHTFKLLDSHWGLILVYAGGAIPFNAWLCKGYFDGLPRSLEEAAKIDGASHTVIFVRIILPLSLPIVVFVAVTNFIGPWMDFILARLIIRSNDKKTLAVGLYEMVTGQQNTEFTMFAAGAVLVAVPITLLFILLQRHMVEGLKAGANK